MSIKLTSPPTVLFVFLVLVSTATAQDLSGSSLAPSASRDTALGATIGSEAEQMAADEPELKVMDRDKDLRDTANRGSTVGADSDDTGLFESESQSGTRAGSTRRTQGSGSRGFNQSGGQQSRSGRSRGTTLRPRLALGFRYTPKLSPKLVGNVQASLRRIPSLRNNSSIRISIEKNVVILEGVVATAHDRAMSAQLVALSPGVYKIDNRLIVADADSPSPEAGR